MGLGEFFGKINEKMNSGYNKIVEFLDAKGIPAQKYTDFLEEKGIPAMWFTLLMILVIISVIVLLVTIIFTPSTNLTISIMTNDGFSPDSVFLNITKVADGQVIISEQVKDGTEIKIKGVGVGDSLYFSGTLEGYSYDSPNNVSISEKNLTVTLIFNKEEQTGSVSFKVINKEEQTSVANALISFSDSGDTLSSGPTDEYGAFKLILPMKKINVTVDKDGYEPYSKTIDLLEGNDYIIELVPKEFDPNAEGNFKFIVKDTSLNSLNNVSIDVYNLKTNSKIGTALTNTDGIGIFNTKKGTSIRFVAKKEGYETFDSNIEGISRTLVTDEELISLSMFAGGSKLKVIVKDELGVTLDNVYVALYTSMLLEQMQETTDIGGVAEFSGLDYTILKYASVYKEGYYPQTQTIDGSGEITFTLEKVDLSKAAIVDVFCVDSDKKPVGDAFLELSYDENSELFPLAYPNPTTSVTGYFTFNFKPDVVLYASASTEEGYGSASLLLKQGRNRLDISMTKTGSKFTMYLYDKDGNPLSNAHVMLFDKQGNLVFDGYTDATGKIEADALGNKELDMYVTDENGNNYSMTINPKDKMQIKLDAAKNTDNLFVALSKVTDLEGNEVSALQKGKTYFLLFNIFWPAGFYNGGLHVRVGKDSDKFAASQDVGIIGYDGIADSVKYGIMFSPLPLPGDYSTDYYSTGSAGQFNKWMELYFSAPSGNSTVKVRIKSKANTDINSFEVRYRAWTDEAGTISRMPVDNILGQEENTKTKYGLYADAYMKEISLMSGSLNCQYDVCVSYKIIDDQYTYDIAKFNSVLDYYYALDVELTSTSEQNLSLSVQTEDNPKLYLNNVDMDATTFNPGTENNTKLNTSFDLGAMENKTIRVYFNPFKEGLTKIDVKTITPKGVIEKTIPVNIFPKKEMQVILSSDFIPTGQDFFVIVKESNGDYIPNAQITISDNKTKQNKMFIEGTGQIDLGKEGKYTIKNSLDSAFYLMSVSAPGYLPKEMEFLVGNVGALFVKGENEIIVPKTAKQATIKIPVQNKSKLPIDSMQINVISSTLSTNFAFNARMVTPAIPANSLADMSVSVNYSGAEDMENGVVELEILGVQNSKDIVRVRTKVFVYYNKEIKNVNCLWVSKESLVYSLPAIQNAKEEDSLVVKNNCEYDLKVMPSLVSEDSANYGLQMQILGFDIKKGEEKVVNLSLINQNPSVQADETKILSLYFATDYFTKNIPVSVTIWNASGSLSILTAGQIFISAFKELQSQYVPVIIQNVGRLPIYNIQLAASNNKYQVQSAQQYPDLISSSVNSNSSGITKDYYANLQNAQSQYNSVYNSPSIGSNLSASQGINFIPATIQVLAPGQSTMLQGYINMPSSSKQTEMYYLLNAKGTVQGLNQPITAQSMLVIHVSPDKCVTLKQETKLTYISDILGKDLARTFTLINNCAEPVNITGINESDLFGNKVVLSAPNGSTINLGQEKEFILTITASKEISRDNSVFVKAQLGTSNAPFNIPLIVNLRFGGGASTSAGEANVSEEKRIKNCTTNEEVSVFYPRMSNADCSTMGYCDGESMSKFLIAKLKFYLDVYNKKLATINNKLINTNCKLGSTACSFEDFGLEPLEMDVYFANDKLTEEQMKLDFKKMNMGLLETAITDKVVLTDVTSTWAKRLYLDKQLDGCGKYKIRITGAVMVINNDSIQRDSYNMYIEVLSKEKTPQCDIKVQNALNFLPKDAQTKKDNPYGLRIGYVDYASSNLEKIAAKVSTSLFSVDRYMKSKPNTIFLKTDSVAEGNLVEFSIAKTGTDVVTTVKINKNLDLSNVAIIDDIVKAIMGFINGNFDGCMNLTSDGVPNSAQVKSGTGGITGTKKDAKEVYSGDIKIGVCDKLPLGKGKWSCTINLESQSLGRLNLALTYPEGTGFEAYIDSPGQKSKSVDLKKNGNKYEGSSKITVEISDPFLVNSGANNDSVGLFYYAEKDGIQTDPIRIGFDPACGITPQLFVDSLLQNTGQNEKGFSNYALIYEPGVESRETCKLLENFLKSNPNIGKGGVFNITQKGSNKYALINYEDCQLDQKSIVAAMTDNVDASKLGVATAAGMAACMTLEMGAGKVLTKLLGPIGFVASAVDCGIMMSFNVGSELYKTHRLKAEAGLSEKNALDSIHDGLASVPVLGTILGMEEYNNIDEQIAAAQETQDPSALASLTNGANETLMTSTTDNENANAEVGAVGFLRGVLNSRKATGITKTETVVPGTPGTPAEGGTTTPPTETPPTTGEGGTPTEPEAGTPNEGATTGEGGDTSTPPPEEGGATPPAETTEPITPQVTDEELLRAQQAIADAEADLAAKKQVLDAANAKSTVANGNKVAAQRAVTDSRIRVADAIEKREALENYLKNVEAGLTETHKELAAIAEKRLGLEDLMDETGESLREAKNKLATTIGERDAAQILLDDLIEQRKGGLEMPIDDIVKIEADIVATQNKLNSLNEFVAAQPKAITPLQDLYDASQRSFSAVLAEEETIFEGLKNAEGARVSSEFVPAKIIAEENAKKILFDAESALKTATKEVATVAAEVKAAQKAVTAAEAIRTNALANEKSLLSVKEFLKTPTQINEALTRVSNNVDELDDLVRRARGGVNAETKAGLESAIRQKAITINKEYAAISQSLSSEAPAKWKFWATNQQKKIIKAYNKLGLAGAETDTAFGKKLVSKWTYNRKSDALKNAIDNRLTPPTTAAEAAVETKAVENAGKEAAATKVKATKPVAATEPPKVTPPPEVGATAGGTVGEEAKTVITKTGTSKFGNFMKGMAVGIIGGTAGTIAFYAMLDYELSSSKLNLITIDVTAPRQIYNYSSYVGSVNPLFNTSRDLNIFEGSDGNELDNCSVLGQSKGFQEVQGTKTGIGGSGTVGSEPSAYDSLIIKAANSAGIEPELLKAILKSESGFNTNSISGSGCSGLGQICRTSANIEYIKVQCSQSKTDGPKKCDVTTCKSSGSYVWCDACTSDGPNCVADDRFDPEKNLMASALIVKSKANSVGDCGKDKIKAWVAAYNMGQKWVNQAVVMNGGNCDDWANEVWYKLKEITDTNPDLTYEKIANKKGDYTNTSSDYVAKIYDQYLAYKNNGLSGGQSTNSSTGSGVGTGTSIANNAKPLENCSEIMLVGDSLTVGYSPIFNSKFCEGVTICAVGGKQTDWMFQTCFTDAKLANIKYVVIMGGINDLSANKAASTIRNNLTQMYSKAKSKGIPVIAITLLPWKGYRTWTEAKQTTQEGINNWIKSSPLVSSVLDGYALFDNGSDEIIAEYNSGKLHLTNSGYEVLANAVLAKFMELSSASGQTSAGAGTTPPPATPPPAQKPADPLSTAKELLSSNGFDPALLPADNYIGSVIVNGNQITANLTGQMCSKVDGLTGTLVAGYDSAHKICFSVTPGQINPCSGNEIYGLKGDAGFITAKITQIVKSGTSYTIKTTIQDQVVAQNKLAGIAYAPC